MTKPAKNTICLWYDRDAEEAASVPGMSENLQLARVVELSGLQGPGDLVRIEDDAGRKCLRADELE